MRAAIPLRECPAGLAALADTRQYAVCVARDAQLVFDVRRLDSADVRERGNIELDSLCSANGPWPPGAQPV